MASTEVNVGQGYKRLAEVLVPLLMFLGVFGVYAATAEREGVNVDAYAASAGAWRLATAGTPWFDGLDPTKIEGTHKDRGVMRNGQWIFESPNQHVTAQRMPGPILVGVPFYWLLGGSGTSEADFSLGPAAIGASLVTSVAVLLVFLAARRLTPLSHAVATAVAFAFATPTWTISANGLWTHPITQLGIAGAAYAASRSRWWLAGIFLGVGMLGRPHIALIAAILGLGVAWSRRDWRIAVRVAIPTGVSLAALAAWNRGIHGVWSISGTYTYATGNLTGASGGGNGPLGGALLNYAGFLFSFNRGLLIWTPVLLLFIPAVMRARKTLPEWTVWLALGGAAYTLVQLRINDFTGGIFFFGYRHGLELVTCLVPILALAIPHLGRFARRLVPVVVAAQVAVMAIGAMVEGFFIKPELVWRENSFWLALRSNPEVVGGWLVLAVAIGVLLAARCVPPIPATAPRSGSDVPAVLPKSGGTAEVESAPVEP